MAHVDWMTIVGRRETGGDDWTVHHAYVTAAEALEDNNPSFMEAFGRPKDWQIVKPRAPYSYARRTDDATRTLYVHPLASHFTLEVSGTHCQRIAHLIPLVCRDFAGAFSRLDVAVDMATETTPTTFTKAVVAGRIKTRSEMVSSSGETVYLGSRSSERFARIYRYAAPHPRSHLLRAEFQLKGQYANAAAEAIAAGETVASVAAGLGQAFGFTHADWKPGDDPPKALKVATHAQSGSTVYWLTTTVAPLLRRLRREGKLDVQMWFDEFVMAEDK